MTRSVKHAGGLYRKSFDFASRPLRKVQSEAHHLREVEEAGESGETPYIAMLGLFFFLGSVFAIMLGLALAAYYLVA